MSPEFIKQVLHTVQQYADAYDAYETKSHLPLGDPERTKAYERLTKLEEALAVVGRQVDEKVGA